ncbi:alpha/beta fold hydrolase [Caenibius sp. WL]|uniref:alpha/beta fold hydrolase n=1 Tax=Caenibius sp. WL TaxID=2872646 RepID=UPI001C996B48|nr:alpha/beta fold hydrolase [Caenibius sp. WL]QZP07595.1 alpha/beta fold hydrolase [Caenibius sp. WL]
MTGQPDTGATASIGDRVRREAERAIQRNLKGLEFLTAPRQSVGAMASDLLIRRGTMAFYRYRPVAEEVYRVPLLMVTPPSNKGYIFDLANGQSFFEFMLHRGYDIYLLDWMPPRADEAELGIEHYVLDFIAQCAEHIADETGERELTISGYCMGGTLAVLYAALAGAGRIANLLCFTTPIDFHHMHLFRAWADKAHFDVDQLVDALGIIPPELMLGAFDLMRPANRTAGMMHLWANMWNDDFVKSYRMFDRWGAETLPMPGRYFRQIIKQLLWDNALLEGRMQVGGRHVDLSAITAPILSIVAEHDHVVAREAAAPLLNMTGSQDCEEILSKGGHVSVVAGASAVRRLWPSIDEWLGKRSV